MDYYKITPMIVPADKESEIRIEPLFGHAEFPREPGKVVVQFFPWDGQMAPDHYHSYDGIKESPEMIVNDWHFDGKCIVFKRLFSGEQEFNVLITVKDDRGNVKKNVQLHLYALKDDLYALRPFRGNIHIHTSGSDGKEEACYVAARFRELGMDFCSISDHRNYGPSITAMDYWKELHPDFKLFPGEEVHSPGNPVHILNFGGRYSVHKKSCDNEEEYRREVADIEAQLPQGLSKESSFAIAAAEWVFDEVRKAGGVAVFCHPYWYTQQYVINTQVSDTIFQRRKFDAFELLGGFYKHLPGSNNLQVVRYYDECARGNVFPVTGSDDSHGTDRFLHPEQFVNNLTADLAGWYSTVVFAKSCEFADIAEALRNGMSVAAEEIEGEMPRVYSTFRLSRYASFLQRWYFPMHKTLCAAEGALMLRVLSGDSMAAEALKQLRGSVQRYQAQVFGK